METDLASVEEYGSLATISERAKEYASKHVADSTKRAYQGAWQRFEGWCVSVGVESMPPTRPEVLAMYIATLADQGYAVGSIRQMLAAVNKAHEVLGLESPTRHRIARYAMQGVARTLGERPSQVDALLPDDLQIMVESMPDRPSWKLRNLRNAAVLTLGFAGAFRRSELVALKVDDLERTEDGYRVLIRRSKTDQTGKGREIGIPYGSYTPTCPVRTLDKWLKVSGIESGHVLCGVSQSGLEVLEGTPITRKAVARIIQAATRRAGLEGWYAGHSLRAGLVTAAAKAGKSPQIIQQQTGHKSINMIMHYIRREGLFDENAAAGIGL